MRHGYECVVTATAGICRRRGSSARSSASPTCARVVEGVAPASDRRGDLLDHRLSLVSSGLGVTACPGHVRRLANSFGLQMRPIVDPKMVRQFCVFLPRRRALNPAAASLLVCLKDIPRKQ
ncbi:MAG: LysR substrate-binding domain-containing protein [Vicinamibacterales bacterium]